MKGHVLLGVALAVLLTPAVAAANVSCEPKAITALETLTGTVELSTYSNGCGIVVQSGGELVVKADAVIDISAGVLTGDNSDAVIRVQSGGKLVIEGGAKFLFRTEASVLISVLDGATFQLESGGAPVVFEDQCEGGATSQFTGKVLEIATAATVMGHLRGVALLAKKGLNGTAQCKQTNSGITVGTSSTLTIARLRIEDTGGLPMLTMTSGSFIVDDALFKNVGRAMRTTGSAALTSVSRIYASNTTVILDVLDQSTLGVFERSIIRDRPFNGDIQPGLIAGILLYSTATEHQAVIRYSYFTNQAGTSSAPHITVRNGNSALIYNNTFVGDPGNFQALNVTGTAVVVGNLFLRGGTGILMGASDSQAQIGTNIRYNAFYGFSDAPNCAVALYGNCSSGSSFLLTLSVSGHNLLYKGNDQQQGYLQMSDLQTEAIDGYEFSPTSTSTLLDQFKSSDVAQILPPFNGDVLGRTAQENWDIGASQPVFLTAPTPQTLLTGSLGIQIVVEAGNVPTSAFWKLMDAQGATAKLVNAVLSTDSDVPKYTLTFDLTDSGGNDLPAGNYSLWMMPAGESAPPLGAFPSPAVTLANVVIVTAPVLNPDTSDVHLPDVTIQLPDVDQPDAVLVLDTTAPDVSDDMQVDAVDDLALPTPDVSTLTPDVASPTADVATPTPDVQSSPQAPSVPTVTYPVHTSAIADSQPTIRWTASSDPQGDSVSYVVQVHSDGSFGSGTQTKTLSGTEWTVETVLTTNMVYYVRVKATDGTNESEWSRTTTFLVTKYASPDGTINYTGPKASCNNRIVGSDLPMGPAPWLVATLILGLGVLRRRRSHE